MIRNYLNALEARRIALGIPIGRIVERPENPPEESPCAPLVVAMAESPTTSPATGARVPKERDRSPKISRHDPLAPGRRYHVCSECAVYSDKAEVLGPFKTPVGSSLARACDRRKMPIASGFIVQPAYQVTRPAKPGRKPGWNLAPNKKETPRNESPPKRSRLDFVHDR